MFKKFIFAALIAIFTKAQDHNCNDKVLNCITPESTLTEIEGCKIRE